MRVDKAIDEATTSAQMMANKAINQAAASAQMMADKAINKIIATGPRAAAKGASLHRQLGGHNNQIETTRVKGTRGWEAKSVEVDTPANKRRCHNKRHGEEEEVTDAMAMTEEDAAGIGTVAAGWEDEDNEIK